MANRFSSPGRVDIKRLLANPTTRKRLMDMLVQGVISVRDPLPHTIVEDKPMTDDDYTDYAPDEPEEELDEDQLAEDAEIDRQIDRFYDGDED